MTIVNSMSQQFCSSSSDYTSSLYYVGESYFLLGASRICAMCIFVIYNLYNSWLIKKMGEASVRIEWGLILPSYLPFIYTLIFIDLFFGVIAACSYFLQDKSGESFQQSYVIITSLQLAAFHSVWEGIAIFLMRYGAGVRAFKISIGYGVAWGCVSFIIAFFGLAYRTNLNEFQSQRGSLIWYTIYVSYFSILAIFYLGLVILPNSTIYRRPALINYSAFNFVISILWIILASIYEFDKSNISESSCVSTIIGLIFKSILQPLVVWRTLQKDSQYWQGLSPDKDNPLAGVWDHVDIATATCMGDGLTDCEENAGSRGKSNVPRLIHFGQIKLDKNNSFVAGGFSRVYFGELLGGRVALKIRFAMELTPEDVQEFYQEAKTLYLLQHTNVVSCKGICVMPPAIAIVLESCAYGSLFDFLHKEKPTTTASFNSAADIINPAHVRILSSNSSFGCSSIDVDSMSWDIPEGAYWNVVDENEGDDITELTESEEFPRLESITIRSTSSEPGMQMHQIRSSVTESEEGGGDWTRQPRASESINSEANNSVSPTIRSQMARPSLHHRISKSIRASISAISHFSGVSNSKTSQQSLVNESLASLMPLKLRIRMAIDALSAVEFLHSKGFMHCDIKSLNFLVAEDFCVKLTDMGETKHVDAPPKNKHPPIPARNWAPPEVLSPFATPYSYTMKSDVFGATMVAYEILSLKLPFGNEPELVTASVWYHKLTLLKLRPRLPPKLPASVKNIIGMGWNSDPLKRPTATEVIAVFVEWMGSMSESTLVNP